MPFTGITVPPPVALALGAAVPGPPHPGLQAGVMGAPSRCWAPPSISNLCPEWSLWCPGTLRISCPGCVVDTVLVAFVSFGEASVRAKCEED